MNRYWPFHLLLLAAMMAAVEHGRAETSGDQRFTGPARPRSSVLVLARHRSQCEASLTGRWVGLHKGQTLHLEFYGDTMLVVNDQYPLSFRATSDSLVATGDTAVVGRYRFSFCRLLLETPDELITLSPQGVLARPLTGRWVGALGTPDGAEAELRLAPNGTARWHRLPNGSWTNGEWERETRIITLTWAGPDTIPWVGHYDVEGNAILFERTVPGSSTTIFHRAFR